MSQCAITRSGFLDGGKHQVELDDGDGLIDVDVLRREALLA